jgi:uncharacterized protein
MISVPLIRALSGIDGIAKTENESSKKTINLNQAFLTISTTLAAFLAVYMISESPAYISYKNDLPQSERHELRPDPIAPSWLISGSPVFRTAVFQHSPDWDTWSGIWECIGPATFAWHYSVDEVIYVLEGSADIEYLGKKFTLHAGDSTRFVAGTIATWVVSDRVKKTFRIEKPRPLIKVMRDISAYFE